MQKILHKVESQKKKGKKLLVMCKTERSGQTQTPTTEKQANYIER